MHAAHTSRFYHFDSPCASPCVLRLVLTRPSAVPPLPPPEEDYWFNAKTGESRWNLPPSCAWQRVDVQGHPIKYINAVTGQEVTTVPPVGAGLGGDVQGRWREGGTGRQSDQSLGCQVCGVGERAYDADAGQRCVVGSKLSRCKGYMRCRRLNQPTRLKLTCSPDCCLFYLVDTCRLWPGPSCTPRVRTSGTTGS